MTHMRGIPNSYRQENGTGVTDLTRPFPLFVKLYEFRVYVMREVWIGGGEGCGGMDGGGGVGLKLN